MRERIEFSAWGARGRKLVFPKYAMRAADYVSASGVVAAAIARKNDLQVVTVCGDGTALDRHGKPLSHHYQATFGTPCRGGGWTPEASCWFSIPVKKEEKSR